MKQRTGCKENKELQELNGILLQQIAALKELIIIKDQLIASKSLAAQQAVQHQPFPISWTPQPYQPTITCETPLPCGCLVMDSHAIKLATHSIRNIV